MAQNDFSARTFDSYRAGDLLPSAGPQVGLVFTGQVVPPPRRRTDPEARLQELQRRFGVQEHELQVHQIELEIQNDELRRANLELERAHARYADLFEFAPVGYVLIDRNGLIEQINQFGCRQLGAVAQRLIGRRLTLFIAEGQRLTFANMLHAVFQMPIPPGGLRHQLEVQLLRPDGQPWDAHLECTLLGDSLPGRGPLARVGLTDVSALKGAQREVEHLNQSLEQQVEMRTAQTRQLSEELRIFVYSMTHDMTRPLRQIQGFSELLARSLRGAEADGLGPSSEPREAPHSARSDRYLENLMEASARMNAQMAALIAFFQSSQPINHHQKVNLDHLIESLFHELRPEAADREVQLTHDPLPTLQADRLSLHTVFSNLISNAIKFTRPSPQARIHVGLQERGENYLFSVQDNGVGFDSRQSERLFGLFQRLHSERSFEGQGMGLALVRRIVNRYGGRVWAESVLDQGAVIWVQLPKEPVALAVSAEAAW